MSHCEVIRNEAGEVLGTVHVTQCLTDEERETLAEYFQWLHDNADKLITPEQAARQDEARRRNRERLERYGLSPAPTPEGTQP